MRSSFLIAALSLSMTSCMSVGPGPERMEAARQSEAQGNPRPFWPEAPSVPRGTPLPKLDWAGKHPNADQWTAFVMKEIPVRMPDVLKSTPKDIKAFCPAYAKLTADQRTEFFAHLIARMTRFESSFKPETKFVECSSKASTYGKSGKFFEHLGKYCIPGHAKDGGIAISRGLLQMSLQSAQGYGCPYTEPAELHDPEKSLSCMMRVLNRFVPAPRQYEGKVRGHGSLAGYDAENERWLGAAAYWSVMRDRAGSDSFPAIKSYLAGLPLCR